jgi:sulfoxide reductase heme-binding subunit YedZ
MMVLADRINVALRPLPAWTLYPLGLIPAAWLWWQGATGGLGPEPIRALEHELGRVGLQFLIAALAVTPLRRFAGIGLLRFRRALGMLAFWYVLQHLGVWLVIDVRDPALIWADIVKRPYITVGMVAFAALLPLALTSTDRAVRRLGARRWRRLHLLVYPAALLAALHFVLLVKGWPAEPLVYAAILAALLALRLLPAPRRAAA